MNLAISSINTQTTSSQNISSKGILGKIFRTNKNLTKDVFVPSAAATASASAAVANNTQNSKETEAMDKVYGNMEYMYMFARPSQYKDIIKDINTNLEKLPENSTKAFINEVMNCITVTLENNFDEICSLNSSQQGMVMGMQGRFLLKTCHKLIRLETDADMSNNKDFIEQVQKDVLTSKNLIELINKGDWKSAKKIEFNYNDLLTWKI